MTVKGAPIIFFGNERIATSVQPEYSALEKLIQQGFSVKGLVISNRYFSKHSEEEKVEQIAKRNNITIFNSAQSTDIESFISMFNPQAGILIAYGRIIPQKIIDLFPQGIINLHPSLLPKYRGPTPIEEAILDNAKLTGVSLMKLASKMDAGPIIAQAKIKLEGNESKQKIANDLLQLGTELLVENMTDILSGKAKSLEQSDEKATYTKLISKSDGAIDWSKPADQLEREIRAYHGWPTSFAELKGLRVIITKARIVEDSGSAGATSIQDNKLVIYCGVDALEIEKIQPAGKKEMSGSEFLIGYKDKLGL